MFKLIHNTRIKLVLLQGGTRRCINSSHLDEGSPPMVVWLPLHPPLKDLASPWHISQHLLHVDVLVPQLIYPRQDLHRPVPNIASVVDEAVAHLHFCVLQPNSGIRVSHLQCSLPHGAGSPEVLLTLLPLCILQGPAKMIQDVLAELMRLSLAM